MDILLYGITFLVGAILTWVVLNFMANSKFKRQVKEAEQEAEVIKKNKLLEVKEQALQMKSEFEKQVNSRNSKLQAAEAKIKQRELSLTQKQEELQRKRSEVDTIKTNLEAQLEVIDKKKQDLDKLHKQEVERLEALSGLSAEEVKEKLVEALKDEAQSQDRKSVV